MPGFYACQCKLGYRLIDDLCQGKSQGRADPKLMLRGYFLSYLWSGNQGANCKKYHRARPRFEFLGVSVEDQGPVGRKPINLIQD